MTRLCYRGEQKREQKFFHVMGTLMFKWIVIAILVLVILAGGGAAVAYGRAAKKPANVWKSAKVKRGDLNTTVMASGKVGPVQTVQIGAQASGLVKEVRKGPNDSVKKGEVLALLDTELLDADRRAAQVRLNQVRAAAALLQIQHDDLRLRDLKLKSDREHKKLSLDRAKATFDMTKKVYDRSVPLVGMAMSQLDLERLQTEALNANRDHSMLKLDVELCDVDAEQILADTRKLAAQEEQAQADVLQAEAALARAETNLRYATITSPIDGVVLERTIELGQTIAASFQTPNLFKIASTLTEIRIEAHVDEADIGRIAAGQDVKFEVDAYSGESLSGQVLMARLQPTMLNNQETTPVTYPVVIRASNPADAVHPFGKLLPGMTASLQFTIEHRADVLLLPAAALRFKPENAPAAPSHATTVPKPGAAWGTIYLAGSDGALVPKSIAVGASSADSYELIESPLKEGDAVVTGEKHDGNLFNDEGD